jgi:hypothetical protein
MAPDGSAMRRVVVTVDVPTGGKFLESTMTTFTIGIDASSTDPRGEHHQVQRNSFSVETTGDAASVPGLGPGSLVLALAGLVLIMRRRR